MTKHRENILKVLNNARSKNEFGEEIVDKDKAKTGIQVVRLLEGNEPAQIIKGTSVEEIMNKVRRTRENRQK